MKDPVITDYDSWLESAKARQNKQDELATISAKIYKSLEELHDDVAAISGPFRTVDEFARAIRLKLNKDLSEAELQLIKFVHGEVMGGVNIHSHYYARTLIDDPEKLILSVHYWSETMAVR